MKQISHLRPILCICLLCSFIFTGCHVLKTERPAENYYSVNYTPGTSSISIPLETNLKTLKKLVNREIPGVILSDTSFNDNNRDNLMLRVSRKDSIELTVSGNQVLYRVPLNIWLRKRIAGEVLGYSVGTNHDATAEIALKFKTSISLNKDFTINAVTISDGYEWIRYPRLMSGMLQIPLPVIGDMLVESNLPLITREIDQSIRKSLDFRHMMTEAWKSIQKPFLVSEEYSLWLKLTPVELSTVPLKVSGSLLRHTIGLTAIAQLYSGAEPPHEINPVLPPLKITSSIPDRFSINFSLDIPFSQINQVAQSQYDGYLFTYRNYKITVRDISIYGQGENLIVAMRVEGSIRGSLFLAGKPVYDKAAGNIRIDNLDFSVSTKNVLVKTGSWLFHSGLVQKMAAGLVFPTGEHLQEAREQISGMLQKDVPMGQFRVSGNIEKFEADKVLITPGSVKAYFQLEGGIRVKMDVK